MTTLYMIELRPDLNALLRFLHGQGFDSSGDEDLGYGIHAWLAAAFGELAPKPWRLLFDRRRPARVLGYASCDAEQLRQRIRDFSEPSVYSVCPDPETMIASRAMPTWRSGRRLAFEVQCCPVARKASSGEEKDLFLIHADTAEQGSLKRDTVYCEWVQERLERDNAANVRSINLVGFRLVGQTRQGRGDAGRRSRSRLVRPLAILQGELEVGDPAAFSTLLARGVGRHRSFGYGMLLLRPPS